MNFDMQTEQLSSDAYVVSLAGEVDLYTVPKLEQEPGVFPTHETRGAAVSELVRLPTPTFLTAPF
jgi:hypothetical protein